VPRQEQRRLTIGAPPIRMVSASLKCATTRAMRAFNRVVDVAGQSAIKDRRKKMGAITGSGIWSVTIPTYRPRTWRVRARRAHPPKTSHTEALQLKAIL
jgi:hypothetical protein